MKYVMLGSEIVAKYWQHFANGVFLLGDVRADPEFKRLALHSTSLLIHISHHTWFFLPCLKVIVTVIFVEIKFLIVAIQILNSSLPPTFPVIIFLHNAVNL